MTSFPLPRPPAPFDITEEQSAEVKAVLDRATLALRETISVHYPLEYDEWVDETERGDRL